MASNDFDEVKEWIANQLEDGEDPEIIKESIALLGYAPTLVDEVIASMSGKKQLSKDSKDKEKELPKTEKTETKPSEKTKKVQSKKTKPSKKQDSESSEVEDSQQDIEEFIRIEESPTPTNNQLSADKSQLETKAVEPTTLEKKVKELEEEIKNKALQEIEQYEDTRVNIPKELIPEQDVSVYALEHKKPMSDLDIKLYEVKQDLRRYVWYLVMFIGVSLILLGSYVYFYF